MLIESSIALPNLKGNVRKFRPKDTLKNNGFSGKQLSGG